MEAQKEAQRIMTMSVWKMYHSRMQRGGLRLHRSLQLSLVMRSARELYLSAKVETDEAELSPFPAAALAPAPNLPQPMTVAEAEDASLQVSEEAIPAPEPMETQEARENEPAPACSCLPPVRNATLSQRSMKPNRKRRSSSLGQGGEAGLVPSKKARLEEETAPTEGKTEVEAEDLERRQSQVEEGPFPSLARVLQKRFSGILSNTAGPPKPTAPPPSCELQPGCRQADHMINILVRTVVAF
ncbi:immediate early response gene 2 protein [Phascolarctos cinereus]|uniref:Immediate early response gene 2 protein n=1 Tax=Phascolarctos cinereus TaxID=38626 RepID=A0A6P5L5D3_PHACI|nr:immediate early response gene 2 protein [Phascolarctos cinereus]